MGIPVSDHWHDVRRVPTTLSIVALGRASRYLSDPNASFSPKTHRPFVRAKRGTTRRSGALHSRKSERTSPGVRVQQASWYSPSVRSTGRSRARTPRGSPSTIAAGPAAPAFDSALLGCALLAGRRSKRSSRREGVLLGHGARASNSHSARGLSAACSARPLLHHMMQKTSSSLEDSREGATIDIDGVQQGAVWCSRPRRAFSSRPATI